MSSADPATLRAPGFSFTATQQGTTKIFSLVGELDIASVREVQTPLSRAVADGVEPVVIDLSEVAFVDAAGIRLIIGATAQASDAGLRLAVLRGAPQVQRAFGLC